MSIRTGVRPTRGRYNEKCECQSDRTQLLRHRLARRDAGFSMAALVIFLTAASILLTISVPSYVMEAKREQEKELIFRGEEYTRAIQKYQRTLNLLPTSVDDLLSSNGTRFLRKAYADPVSGEPWRVIILNADGTLTGSNVYQTMGQVPTTTSVRNTALPATAPKATWRHHWKSGDDQSIFSRSGCWRWRSWGRRAWHRWCWAGCRWHWTWHRWYWRWWWNSSE